MNVDVRKIFNFDVKVIYLDQFNNEETKDVYSRLFKKSFETEVKHNKDIYDFSDEQIETFLKDVLQPKSKESARSLISVLGNYIQWAIDNNYSKLLLNPLKRRQEFFYEFVKQDKTYISFDEKEAMISLIYNKQDSFIIQALWEGVQGTKLSELVSLKLKDLDRKNHQIKIHNDHGDIVRIIDNVEDRTFEYAILANMEHDYHRENNEANYPVNFGETVPLPNSNYILKSGKTNLKNDGGEKVSHYTVYNRLDNIRKLEELEEYHDVLTTKNIVRSGMIYWALKLFLRDGELGRKQIEEVCARFDMKYKWSLRDFLNTDILRELYPEQMFEYEKETAK